MEKKASIDDLRAHVQSSLASFPGPGQPQDTAEAERIRRMIETIFGIVEQTQPTPEEIEILREAFDRLKAGATSTPGPAATTTPRRQG